MESLEVLLKNPNSKLHYKIPHRNYLNQKKNSNRVIIRRRWGGGDIPTNTALIDLCILPYLDNAEFSSFFKITKYIITQKLIILDFKDSLHARVFLSCSGDCAETKMTLQYQHLRRIAQDIVFEKIKYRELLDTSGRTVYNVSFDDWEYQDGSIILVNNPRQIKVPLSL